MNLAVCFEIPFTGLKIITENLCDGVAALECLVVNHECDVSVMKVKTPRGREFLFWLWSVGLGRHCHSRAPPWSSVKDPYSSHGGLSTTYCCSPNMKLCVIIRKTLNRVTNFFQDVKEVFDRQLKRICVEIFFFLNHSHLAGMLTTNVKFTRHLFSFYRDFKVCWGLAACS